MTSPGWTARSVFAHALLTLVCTGACQSGPTATDYLDHAERALADDKLGRARTYVDRATRKGSPERTTRRVRARIERRLAEQAASHDRLEKGLRHYRNAAAIDPRRLDTARAYLQAARLAKKLGEPPTEIAEIADKAVEANPALADARQIAGRMWDEAGRPEAAIEAYLWLWQADHSRLEIGRRLATLYRQLDRPDDAAAILRQLQKADPTNPRTTLRLATLYAETDRPEQARRLFEQLLEEHPDRPGLLMEYARFLQRRGETDRAARLKRRAYEQMPGVDRREMRELK